MSELFAHNVRRMDVPAIVTDRTPHPVPEKREIQNASVMDRPPKECTIQKIPL